MKLFSTFLMLFLTLFCNAQDINTSFLDTKIELFKIENKSLRETLKELEKRSNIKIGYSGKNNVFKQKTSISVKDKSIKDILNSLLFNTNYEYKVLKNKILIYKRRVKQKIKKHTLNGYIKEIGSKEHLLGVSVYISELGIGTYTNNYGFYSLTIPEGIYTLTVSYIGYKTIYKNINLKVHTPLSINMVPKEEFLEEVVVTNQKTQKESETTLMGITKLKINDVKSLPAFLGEKDVLKTLQLLPGIQSGVEATSGIYVRGGSPDQNLIILDEAPVYNSNHLFGLFSIFNGDGIKSVEVFKGGFPARFGGRLSSVININMKDGNKEQLSGKFNIGLLSSSFLLEGPIKKEQTSFLVNGRRTYADLISKPFQPKGSEVGYFFQDLNFKIHHVFNDKNKLFWSNYYGEDNFKSENRRNNSRSDSKITWGNITSTLRWNHQFNSKLFSNTSLIFSNYKFRVENENKNENITTKFLTSSGINDYGFKTDFQYLPNPNHTLQFGVASTYHKFTPQRLSIKETGIREVTKNQELNSFENAAYIEDNWKITKELSASSGVRISNFNHKSTNYLALEPRFSLAWKALPTMAFKASYSKMNQYIHLLTNSGIGLPTDLWVSSTNKVKPQISEQIALGVAKDFKNTGYSFTMEAYYKKMDDVISYKEGASFLVLSDIESGKNVSWEENITTGKGWAYGSEFLLRKQKGKLTGWLGYTLSRTERKFNALNLGKRFDAKYDRRHNISLVGIYKLNKKMTLSANWSFNSGLNYTLPNLQTVNSDSEFPIDSGSTTGNESVNEFTTQRNNFKGEPYHRLDVSIQFHKKTKRNNLRTWGVSLYNSYGNKNPLFYYVADSDISFTSLGGSNLGNDKKTLRRYSLLVFVPSINYTLKF